jgi:hypothetical protein
MRYYELFEDLDSDSIMDQVRSAVVDILTPLASNGVQYVTVQQLLDELKNSGTGVDIDRSMLMQILDPDTVKLISSIEGDRVTLNNGNGDGSERAVPQKQKQREQDDIKKTAATQAKKSIGDS